MRKIFVNKDEGVAEIVEKIVAEPDNNVALSIPRGSKLASSVSNFHLIKRETETAGKNVFIESVDDTVLALAKASRIEAIHPFFEAEKRVPAMSDIVPRSPAAVGKPPTEKKAKPAKAVFHPAKIEEAAPSKSEVKVKVPQKKEKEEAAREPKRKFERRWYRSAQRLAVVLVVLAVIVAVAFWATNTFFGRAVVAINFNKTPWSYEHVFTADVSVSGINFDNNVLPAELFTASKDTVQPYHASGMTNSPQKATGKITIYNVYSSKSQVFIAKTRFVTPDGKIFRLVSQAVVPGAQTQNGKLIPSSIDANIVADQAGPDYNVGPVPRLTIPSFKENGDMPRYNGFYGEIKGETSGGSLGQQPVPTTDDINNAKSKTTDILRAWGTWFESSSSAGYPASYKILDGASQFNVTKLAANLTVDKNGNFNVIGEAAVTIIGFCESEPCGTGATSTPKSLKSFLLTQASKDNPGTVFDKLDLSYSQVSADFQHKKETFYLSASGTLKPAFSVDDFKSKILGQKVNDARSTVAAISGLSDARISVWPIWLGSIPADPNRVSVMTN